MDFYFNREQRERLWGPSPQKVSWTELCKRLIAKDPAFADEISFDGSPPFMSDQILKLVGGKHGSAIWNTEGAKKILKSLRPEDAIHVPQLRFDYETGKIIEWNRSLSDLSGISAAQVVGKTYAEVLDEFLPNLSKEYKEAAVEWVKMKEDETSEYSGDAEDCRADYLFPLPLPLRYDSSFKYVSGRNRHYDEYIELLAARSNRLFELYPKLSDFRPVPQCKRGEAASYIWNFDTSGWVGGIEFTLRRKQYLPSLQTLCRELLPKGADHAVNEDGSLAVTKSFTETSVTSKGGGDDVYTTISKYMRSCGPIGIKYIREVMNAVCKKDRNQYNMRTKIFHFSTDWSTHADTAAIHKHVLQALGGAEWITEKVEKDKMTWTLNFGPEKGSDGERLAKQKFNYNANIQQIQQQKISETWSNFKKWITPVLSENKNFTFPCGASDSTFVLPTADKPELTVLTLKIEGHERSDGSYGEEKFKAFATVQVPASLNFFQLHRVVCQTMNNSPSGRRETHEWMVPNIASDYEKPITDEDLEYLTLGETYFVENGERMHDDYGHKEVFDTGGGIRQRVSRTGVYVDQDMPFYFLSSVDDDRFKPRLSRRNFGQIKACIHSTCINSVFFQPGTMALMQDGLVKYFTTYKITCTKSEQYTGPLPLNPDINVMQPKCLRGKPEEGDEYWSVDKANKQLHQDRGCLRRNLCKVGADDYLVQMPWCQLQEWPIKVHKWSEARFHAPYPVAVHLTGLDHYPLFLHGEPPLPSSEAYEDYVSTLNGRIDPRFLQENVMGFGGYFAVPFKYGAPGRGGYSYDSDDNESGQSCAIGQVWTREVDEEMKRIDSLQPIKKAKGKKRKAPSKTPAS